MRINFKKLRTFSLITLLIFYIGILIFESFFGFNQGIISKLLSNYDDLSQPLYVLLILFAAITGLVSAAVVVSGFFLFDHITLIVLTSIGIIIGIPLIFILSRKIGHKAFEEYLNLNKNKSKKLKKIFKNDSTALIILFNFVFFLPSTFGGIAGGLGELKMTKLIILSVIGNLINQIAFILFMIGVQNNNLLYIIPSLSAIILNTGIPVLVYRKNIIEVFKVTFQK